MTSKRVEINDPPPHTNVTITPNIELLPNASSLFDRPSDDSSSGAIELPQEHLEPQSISMPVMRSKRQPSLQSTATDGRTSPPSSLREASISESTKRHLRRLSSFMPVKSHVHSSSKMTTQSPRRQNQNARLQNTHSIWSNDDDDEEFDEDILRNPDCFGRRRVTNNTHNARNSRARFVSMDSRVADRHRSNSNQNRNVVVASRVSSVAEIDADHQEGKVDATKKDQRQEQNVQMTKVDLSQSSCWYTRCCRISVRCFQWCDTLFRDVEIEVDRRRVRVHWCTNRFDPYIYEESFVRGTIKHGWEKSLGLLVFVTIVSGAYTLSSANKLGSKEDHEAAQYLTYFFVRAGAWLLCVLIVALNWFCCESHAARDIAGNNKSKSRAKKKKKHKNKTKQKSFLSDATFVKVNEHNGAHVDDKDDDDNDDDDDDDNDDDDDDDNNDGDDNDKDEERELRSWKNIVLAFAFVIFGCVSMAMKAYKYRYEGVAIDSNLNATAAIMERVLAQTLQSSNDTSSIFLSSVFASYTSMCEVTNDFECPAYIPLESNPYMSPNMTLREMMLTVHANDVEEYEVVMNRIWPPLVTVICALIVKRFLPTVAVAIAVAICWLIVFLSGPLSERWYVEWQEIAFVVLAQCIVLFGAKTEDRQERENFLNTFGKHLKAARVQSRLDGMRKNMDDAVAPQTALGSIMKKLSEVQEIMRTEADRQSLSNGGGRRTSILSSEEMMIIDEVKSLLLANIGNLTATTLSSQRWDNVSPEERAWMQQGGIDTSSMRNEQHQFGFNSVASSGSGTVGDGTLELTHSTSMISSHALSEQNEYKGRGEEGRRRYCHSNSIMTDDGFINSDEEEDEDEMEMEELPGIVPVEVEMADGKEKQEKQEEEKQEATEHTKQVLIDSQVTETDPNNNNGVENHSVLKSSDSASSFLLGLRRVSTHGAMDKESDDDDDEERPDVEEEHVGELHDVVEPERQSVSNDHGLFGGPSTSRMSVKITMVEDVSSDDDDNGVKSDQNIQEKLTNTLNDETKGDGQSPAIASKTPDGMQRSFAAKITQPKTGDLPEEATSPLGSGRGGGSGDRGDRGDSDGAGADSRGGLSRHTKTLSTEERRLREVVHECRRHNWNRDTLALAEEGFNPCLVLGMGISQSHTFLKRFDIQRKVWGAFCASIGDGYHSENPYHNASHGADVMNSVHYILDFCGLRRQRGKHHELSSAEFFGALLAALIHDYKVGTLISAGVPLSLFRCIISSTFLH